MIESKEKKLFFFIINECQNLSKTKANIYGNKLQTSLNYCIEFARIFNGSSIPHFGDGLHESRSNG